MKFENFLTIKFFLLILIILLLSAISGPKAAQFTGITEVNYSEDLYSLETENNVSKKTTESSLTEEKAGTNLKKDNLQKFEWIGEKPISYEEYAYSHPFLTKGINPLYEKTSEIKAAGEQEDGMTPIVIIFVDEYIYDNMHRSILRQYQNDLFDEGYTTIIFGWREGAPEGLKDFVLNIYNNPKRALNGILEPDVEYYLAGIVMVGELPVAWAEFDDENCIGYQEFPCDLYFMDMDGEWEDNDGNGRYEVHQGDLDPEIWCGRIYPNTVFHERIEMLEYIQDYFRRVHEFRQGHVLRNKALIYNDDEFKNNITPYIAYFINPEEVVRVTDYIDTQVPDFIRRVCHTPIENADGELIPPPAEHYDWLDVTAHGSSSGMEFFNRFKDSFSVNSFSFMEEMSEPYFMVIRSCGPGRFVENNYLGGRFLFGPHTNTLAVLSSTGVHYTFPYDWFYKSLGDNAALGDAFKALFTDTFHNPVMDLKGLIRPGMANTLMAYCHGSVLLGDPTLKPKKHLAENIKGDKGIFEDYVKDLKHPFDKPDLILDNISYRQLDGSSDYRIEFNLRYSEKPDEVRYQEAEYDGVNFERFYIPQRGLKDAETFPLRRGRSIVDLIYKVAVDGELVDSGQLTQEMWARDDLTGEFIEKKFLREGLISTNAVFSGQRRHIVNVLIDPRAAVIESNDFNNSIIEGVPAVENDEIDIFPTDLTFSGTKGILTPLGFQGYYLSEKVLELRLNKIGRELDDGESYSYSFLLRCGGNPGAIKSGWARLSNIEVTKRWGWIQRSLLKDEADSLSLSNVPAGTILSFTADIDCDDDVPEQNEDNDITRQISLPF